MDEKTLSSIVKEAQEFDVVCFFGFDPDIIEQVNFLKEKTLVFFRANKGLLSAESGFSFYEINCDESHCDLLAFQELCKEKVFQSFFYVVHPDLDRDIMERCRLVQWQCHLSASAWQDFGLKAFKNMISSCYSPAAFLQLKNSLKGVPAFICGAGPSLAEEIDSLKILSNRGVVFAGGAALGYLTKALVPVHIGVGIDPDPSYERALMQGSFEAPFFCQSRFSASILDTIQGSIFRVPGNPGCGLEKWMTDGAVFDGGWTSTTLSVALAIHLGCNPVIFFGMDLSYPIDGSTYASGAFKEQADVLWQDSLSGPLLTQKDWILSAKWLEESMRIYSSTMFYNTSLKGISLDGAQKISSEKLLEELKVNYDIEGFIQVMRSYEEVPTLSKEKVELVEKSLEDSLVLIENLLKIFEKHYPLDPSSKGEFVVNLFDLYDELIYREVLEPLWEIWQFPIACKVPDAYAKKLNQFLFFKKVIQDYGSCLWK